MMGARGKTADVVSLYQAGQPSPQHLPPPPSQPEDYEISRSQPALRNWARNLAANSSVITAVLDSRCTNGIGTGLRYEPLVRDRRGALLTDFNSRIRRALERWRRSPDVTGELCGNELERLCWRCWDTDGEIFLRQVARRQPDGGIPYQVQILEADLVPFGFVENNRIVDGVEKDEWGRPTTYHVYRRRPWDTFPATAYATDLVAIPAESMRHLKRIVRPNQTRGLTLLHSVIFRVSDIAEYAQSHRLAARASADLFMSIRRGPDWQGPATKDDGTPADPRDWNFENLQMIDGLGPDEAVDFHDPQHPNQNATEFLHEEMRQIAAGTRSSFSQIAVVFDRAYAAQRLEINHAWRMVEQDRSQFIEDLARPALYEAPLQWALAAGMLTIPRAADPETIYDVRIDGPTMPTIDPVNDRKADELDQANGWDSRHGLIRKRGKRPGDVDAEREQDDFESSSRPSNSSRPIEGQDSERDDEQTTDTDDE